MDQCEELDKIFASAIRRRTKNIESPQLQRGQGYRRLSNIIQHRKAPVLIGFFTLMITDQGGRLTRSYAGDIAFPPPSDVRFLNGYWVSSLIAYGWNGELLNVSRTLLTCMDALAVGGEKTNQIYASGSANRGCRNSFLSGVQALRPTSKTGSAYCHAFRWVCEEKSKRIPLRLPDASISSRTVNIVSTYLAIIR